MHLAHILAALELVEKWRDGAIYAGLEIEDYGLIGHRICADPTHIIYCV